MQKLYEEAAVQDIADAIREKTGGAETYKIAQMGGAVRGITTGDQIAHADIPDYVKDGVLALAQKVQAVKTASSIVFVTVADAHHATDESTSWKANIDTGNMDACRAIKALSHVIPLDFATFLGDLTFGYRTTTKAQFEAQCREFHRWLEEGLRGIPQLWTPGNHDTGEYFASETGSLTNLYGAALIRKYFSDYNAGAVYGSAQAGYCYRDIPGKKLRIINLNTVEGEITGGETAANALSEAQLLWFAQTLADLGSKADSAAWGFVILGHYPLDWGSARAGGKVLKAYLDGGSVTIGGKTVSFAGKNGAVCYGNFHGHLHNFKTSRIYVVPDNVSQSDPPTQQMAALRICCPSANYYRTNEVGDNNRLDSNQIEFGEETTHSKAPGVTDTAFTVNVINPADKKIYSFCYGAGYDRTLSFDFAVIMRAVKAMLTGCSGSNAATAVEDGAAYTTTLTPKNGYTFDTVTVSTRAQIVMILYNLSGDTTDYSKYYVPFTDVRPSTWYYNAVAWGYDKDIVAGMTPTTFAPDGLITREQMAVLLYGYTEKYAPAYLGGAASLNGFPDAASVSNWAYAAMSWAVGNGLISGIASNGADYLAPSGGATRAQIAAIMMRYCRLTGL